MKKTQLGNSRFLYIKQDIAQVDLSKASSTVDRYLSLSRQVEPVDKKLIVQIKGDQALIGREIAGYPTELSEGLAFKEQNSQEVFEMISPKKALNFKDLLELVKEIEEVELKKLHRFIFDIQHFDAPVLQFN